MGEQALVIKPIVQLPWIAVHFVEFEVFCQSNEHQVRSRVYARASVCMTKQAYGTATRASPCRLATSPGLELGVHEVTGRRVLHVPVGGVFSADNALDLDSR